ncbi:hypothetical protein Droror1_Dr00008431 [Drosera rotundifolia]
MERRGKERRQIGYFHCSITKPSLSFTKQFLHFPSSPLSVGVFGLKIERFDGGDEGNEVGIGDKSEAEDLPLALVLDQD